jgi:hypothetical protein
MGSITAATVKLWSFLVGASVAFCILAGAGEAVHIGVISYFDNGDDLYGHGKSAPSPGRDVEVG